MKNETPQIQELPERRVACVSFQGNYMGNPKVFEELFTQLCGWAGPKGLMSPETVLLSSYPDDPRTTPPDQLRLNVCMTIPEGTDVGDGVEEKLLPGGPFAVMHAELTDPAEFVTAWIALVGWAEQEDYQVDPSRPSYEIYLNDPEQHPEKHHILDLCLSVKAR